MQKFVNHRVRSRRANSIEGFNLLEENNIYEKNIINLVKEIHENEKKCEESKKEKKRNKNNNNQNQYPKIKLTPLNNQTIQYILSCKLRTPNMLTILNAFLSTMKFLSVSADNEDKEKLLYSLSFCLKMDKKVSGSVIFRYGNKGTRFYIVLGGEVSVLILREKTVELTNLNYMKYLLYLKVIKEDELAKRIISSNPKSKLSINERLIDTYYDEIIAFINKYYIMVPINEPDNNEIKKKNATKYLFQKENKEIENSVGLYNYNNNLDFDTNNKNKEDGKIFSKRRTMANIKVNSIQKLQEKNNKLENKEEKKDNKNSDSEKDNSEISDKSFIEKNKEKGKIIKYKKIKKKPSQSSKDISKDKDKPSSIKYKATSKIPNYLELDICTFGPSDISKLVNFVIKNLEEFYSKTSKVPSLEDYIKNCSVDDSLKVADRYTKRELITVFQYFEITRKKEGDIFGELALQHNDNKRTATMIATKDSVFGYLSKNDYNNCLRGVEMKKRKTEVNFIMSFSLFDETNWVNFEKTYFNFLKKEYLTSGQVIINQNDKIENIYFIMEGQIEITTNLNFKEINKIFKQKTKRIKNTKKKNIIKENKKEDDEEEEKENNKEINNIKDQNLDNNTIANNSNNNTIYEKEKNNMHVDNKKFAFLTSKQIKELNESKSFRLCVIDNKDILGLNDICSKDGISFVKATCVSSNVVIFSLKKNILDELKRKNSEIEKNVKNLSDKREKIMIERLKITTNFMFSIVKENKIKMSEVQKIEESKDNKTKEPRTHSALYTKFDPGIYIEYSNTINNHKYSNNNVSKNLFKKSFDKKRRDKFNDNSNKKINNYNLKFFPSQNNLNYFGTNSRKDFSSSNLINKTENNKFHKNFNMYSDIDKNDSLSSHEHKSCFQKFMESVTERVSQIQKTVRDAKFTGLFSPIYTRNIKIGPDKNNAQDTNYKFKLKDSNNNKVIIDKNMNLNLKRNNKTSSYIRSNSLSLSQTANNYVLINKSRKNRSKGKKNSYKLLKLDIKNDSLLDLFKNQKHIVQHQYTLSSKNIDNVIENKKINIITNGTNDPKKIAFSEFSKKNSKIFFNSKSNKLPKFKLRKLKDFNPIEYMKIILGTRYKGRHLTKGQKKFSNMLAHNLMTINYFSNPEFKKNMGLILDENKIGKYNSNTLFKPTKVDLLVYNKTIENNSKIHLRDFSHEQETKQRLCSRNVKRMAKTICFTRTLTNSAHHKY